MAIRGVYSDDEEKLLAEFEKNADTRVGWVKPGRSGAVATAEAIKSSGMTADPWNPLWHVEQYGIATRWGSIIANPWYAETFKPNERLPDVPSWVGFRMFYLLGNDNELFRPIRPGDTIRAWARRPTLTDATSLDGKGPRIFHYIDVDADLINQRDEVVCTYKQWVYLLYLDKQPDPPIMIPEYGYTAEELDYIHKLVEEEEIRGAKIRYWEDVNVGDEPKPVVLGPTNLDLTQSFGTPDYNEVPPRKLRKYIKENYAPIASPYVKDSVTGLFYTHVFGRHGSDRAAQFEGEPHAFLFARTVRNSMTRLVTNWIGDDGFIRKYKWRHIYRTPNGDCLINRGKVVKKYIENGEHLVDLKVWTDDMRGNVTEVSYATVKLVSKNEPYPDVKR